MCQKELEADLSASKSDFLRAVADLSSVKEEKTKLEARICILEARDERKQEGKEPNRVGGGGRVESSRTSASSCGSRQIYSTGAFEWEALF